MHSHGTQGTPANTVLHPQTEGIQDTGQTPPYNNHYLKTYKLLQPPYVSVTSSRGAAPVHSSTSSLSSPPLLQHRSGILQLTTVFQQPPTTPLHPTQTLTRASSPLTSVQHTKQKHIQQIFFVNQKYFTIKN